ncbi:MAG: toxin-antitoxin system HicB family antitoxin, partial [Deltaproteobacteria bacterium]|nr:toxin-antitoxin system HicB family antitoxin [Deltaproteobacteria bacterium]
MARMTLRIPDSLRNRLAAQAKKEGVSMNQYLVFALSRIMTADEVTEEKAGFDAL